MNNEEILEKALEQTRHDSQGNKIFKGEAICAYLLGSRYIGADIEGSDYSFYVIISPSQDELCVEEQIEVRVTTEVEVSPLSKVPVTVTYLDIRKYVEKLTEGQIVAQQILYAGYDDMFELPTDNPSDTAYNLMLFLAYLSTNRETFSLLDPNLFLGEAHERIGAILEESKDITDIEFKIKCLLDVNYLGNLLCSVLDKNVKLSDVIRLSDSEAELYKKVQTSRNVADFKIFFNYSAEKLQEYKSLLANKGDLNKPANYEETCRTLKQSVMDIILGGK